MLEAVRWRLRAHKYRRKTEPQEIEFVVRQLRPGQIAIDIGAYKGAFAYWMLRSVGPGGKVFAFEPQAPLAEYLRGLARRRPNLVVEQMGISDVPGEAELYVPVRPGKSVSQLAVVRAGGAAVAAADGVLRSTVALTSLDAYFAAPERRPIALIKCDVEGHELRAFQGARDILERDRPALLFESENRTPEHAARTRAVFEYLWALGYDGYWFDRIRNRAEPVHTDGSMDDRYSHNFAFVPAGRAP